MFQKFITFLSGIAIIIGLYLTIDALYQPQNKTVADVNFEENYIVERQDIANKTSLNGIVQRKSTDSATLNFQKSGYIQEILVTENDTIYPGETLMIISSEASSDQKENAKRVLYQAQADLKNALNNPKITQKVVYDQNIVNQAQAHLDQIRQQAEQNISLADQQVQNQLQVLRDLENQLQEFYNQNSEVNLNQAKAQVKSALNEAYFYLNKEIWLHDQIQKKYFSASDQVSLKIREKERLAFEKYYTAKWYMENLIEGEDNPEIWALSEALEHFGEALLRLEVAYEEIINGFRDPLYKSRLTDNDKEAIDEARKNIAKGQNVIIKAKAFWQEAQQNVPDYQVQIQELEKQRNTAQAKYQQLQDNFNQVKFEGQQLINQAQQSLEAAYKNAYKTISISTPQDTTALEKTLEKAQENYQTAMSHPDTFQLTSTQKGVIEQVLVQQGDYLSLNQPAFSLKKQESFEIQVIINQDIENNLSIGDQVLVESQANQFPAYVKDIKDNKVILETLVSQNLENNQTVKVIFKTQEKKNALVAPKAYLIEKLDKKFVLLLDDQGNPVLQEIITGIINGQYVEILEGVQEGDKIYLSN
jgi:multidrug resistance efflux pump